MWKKTHSWIVSLESDPDILDFPSYSIFKYINNPVFELMEATLWYTLHTIDKHACEHKQCWKNHNWKCRNKTTVGDNGDRINPATWQTLLTLGHFLIFEGFPPKPVGCSRHLQLSSWSWRRNPPKDPTHHHWSRWHQNCGAADVGKDFFQPDP